MVDLMKTYTVEIYDGDIYELIHAAPYDQDDIEDISPDDYNAELVIIKVWHNGDVIERIDRKWNDSK